MPSAHNPGQAPTHSEELVSRLFLDGDQVRFNDELTPRIGLDYIRKAPFKAALRVGFLHQNSILPRSRYTFITRKEGELHFWDSDRSPHPQALIMDMHDFRKILHREPRYLLLETALLGIASTAHRRAGIRPEWCTVSADRVIVNDRECVGLHEVSVDVNKAGPKLERIFLVDPSREYAIVQVVYKVENRRILRMDIEYESSRGAKSEVWLPSRWSVVRFSDVYGDPNEFAIAYTTKSVVNQSLPAGVFEFTIPRKTFVLDHLRSEPFELKDSDWKWPGHSGNVTAANSDGVTGSPLSKKRSSPKAHTIQRTLLKLITWPWILVTIPSAGILYNGLRKLWEIFDNG